MESRYKIILSSKNLYKEIELSPELKQLKIGTGLDCDVRLHKNLFFGPIELLFKKNAGEWSVICSDNIYLTVGDIRKLMTKNIQHGDLLEVKYFDSDNTVFFLDFLIDFDNGEIRYERVVDTSYQAEIHIGYAAENNIVISSDYVKKDTIVLARKGQNYILNIINSSYGVYHNGKRADSGELVKDGDFISVSDFFFCIKEGRIWTQIRDGLKVNGIRFSDRPAKNDFPKFNRCTRVKTVVNEEKIEILDPPAKPEKPKANLIQRLLPSMGMLIAAVFMASRGGSMIIFSAISGIMSIVTAVMGLVEGKKEFKTKTAERIESYNAYIEQKKEKIEEIRQEELLSLSDIYISQVDEIESFSNFAPTLFDRRREDEDFLHIRLGSGAKKSIREINYKKQERLEIEDDLQRMPGELCEKYKYIEGAPIICNLKDANAIGIVGEEPLRFDFLKNIVIDIAARQFYSDVKMVFVAEPCHKDRIHMLRFLPQLQNDTIGTRTIVTDDESKNLVFEYIYKELTLRRQKKGYENNIVVFLYDEYGFKNHPISKFVDDAGSLGISFVFFGEKQADIPMGCTSIVEIVDAQNAMLIDAKDKNSTVEFEYPRISEQETQEIVDILAPVYTEELSLEGTLTKNISMFEMLNIIAVDDINLEKRWGSSQVTKSMAAPLGVSKSGLVYLDLHDKAHGPHGLVAGTTGSGKSEILQTYILAMATLYHPYEIGFVIIDFKGGGMVNQFKNLPHLVGAITNIDGKEIDRSLKSIKAELQKRQRYFADADVNHIDKYIEKYKKGEVVKPLPHLIIIVDEFAELKAEQPEFMKELISAARIGRSLGVHLILATQKPSGQVNEQIWSNSRFKLCLKVQSQEDSNEVLKSPLAAEIKEPGRAYLQVGNNEIFELFQSAYSGAPEKTESGNIKEFTVYNIAESGKRVPVFTQKKSGSSKGNATQLDAIVEYVSKFCEKQKVKKLPDICLPALAEVINYPARLDKYELTRLPLGVYDDPTSQYQGYAYFNVSEENMLIIGAPQTGKTNLVQTIIRAVASAFSPQDVTLYIADFGSMYLCNYTALCHVGGVVTLSETERMKNLFKLLMGEISTRKDKFQVCGLSSFASYREAGYDDLPQIIFILENFSAYKEIYGEAYEEYFLYLLREGTSCGVSIIITNGTTVGIGYKYISNFASKLAFKCNDSNEYSSVFDRCRMAPGENPGRGLCKQNAEIYDVQFFLSFQGEKEIERSNRVKEYIADVNTMYPGQHAKEIPCVPEQLGFDYIERNFTREYSKSQYPLGLDYTNVDVVLLDLKKISELCIVSREHAKKQAIVCNLMAMLNHYYLVKPVKLFIIDSVERPYKMFSSYSYVEKYTIDYSEVGNIIDELLVQLEYRYDLLIDGETEKLARCEHIIVIIDSPNAIEYISSNRDLYEKYIKMVKDYSSVGISFWYTNIDNAVVSYSSDDLLKRLRDNRKLITDNIQDFKFCDIPVSIARSNKVINPGDVFVVEESEVTRIKMAEED